MTGATSAEPVDRGVVTCRFVLPDWLAARVGGRIWYTRPTRAEVALGNPSFVWRFGQDRRLDLIRQYVPLEGARILDIGCGLGVYVRKFREFSDRVCGIDIDAKRLREGAKTTPGLMLAVGEIAAVP